MSPTAAPPSIGIDIGGTSVKLGAVAADGAILARRTLPVRPYASFDALADALAEAATALSQACPAPVAAIGICSPGVPDPATGEIVSGAYNIPVLRGQSMLAALRARGLPARAALNDGIAAARGEHAHGAAQGLARFAMITLGTGVGGCVMLRGVPVTGPQGHPPEIGAMVLDPHGPPGHHGLRGTLETYACAAGFTAAYAAEGGPAGTAPDAIFAAAARADPAATRAVDATCRRIAQAFGALINALALDACLIGGGLSQAGPVLATRVQAHLADFTWPSLLATAEVRLAATGNDAGLLGAAAAARDA